MLNQFILTLGEGHIRKAIQVGNLDDIILALNVLGLNISSPVLVIIGGASELDDKYFTRLELLFNKVLAPLAQKLNMTVIDGGTDGGVMSLIGRARKKLGATFPLLGIVPEGLADFPNTPFVLSNDKCKLEENHTHFILVPGKTWGSESSWIAKIATSIAQNQPSIAILANGGEITWKDAQQNISADRPVIVIEGSGRTADILADAIEGDITDERARSLLESQLLHSIDMKEDLREIFHILSNILEAQ